MLQNENTEYMDCGLGWQLLTLLEIWSKKGKFRALNFELKRHRENQVLGLQLWKNLLLALGLNSSKPNLNDVFCCFTFKLYTYIVIIKTKTNRRSFTQFLEQKQSNFYFGENAWLWVTGWWEVGGKCGLFILYVDLLLPPWWAQIYILPMLPSSGLVILNLSISPPQLPSPCIW